MKRLHSKFIATVAAAALTVTAIGAAPARADDDFLKTLAIVAGAALVGKVIYDQTQAQRQRATTPSGQLLRVTPELSPSANAPVLVSTSLRPVARPVSARVGGTPVYDTSPLDVLTPRPLPERVDRANRKLLPGDCLRSSQTWDGRVRYFGERCLERSYGFTNQLPQECAVQVRAENRLQQGYEARCLRDRGYQLARN
jgi:hypothetical protein